MASQNWLVLDDGRCEALTVRDDEQMPVPPYRLYRFLTDVEDILLDVPDDRDRILAICPLVRKLLHCSPWLQAYTLPPSPKTGWSVLMLYEEPEFKLTVQLVAWLPGHASPIHNHATWGIVALLGGQEKNTLWRRAADPEHSDRIEQVRETILSPGDTISFTADAIHHVEPLGDEPTITFNIYGVTNYQKRFRFDAKQHTAVKF
ncbi:MAG: cupin [Coleofasciculaceae cyanobacterium SM2_3_26]|nr:cupin [Coleofasciculaceae cyanobacterium SM2_3_26]